MWYSSFHSVIEDFEKTTHRCHVETGKTLAKTSWVGGIVDCCRFGNVFSCMFCLSGRFRDDLDDVGHQFVWWFVSSMGLMDGAANFWLLEGKVCYRCRFQELEFVLQCRKLPKNCSTQTARGNWMPLNSPQSADDITVRCLGVSQSIMGNLLNQPASRDVRGLWTRLTCFSNHDPQSMSWMNIRL